MDKLKIYNGLVIACKILFVLAGLGVLAGIKEGEWSAGILLALIFAIPGCICFGICCKIEKDYNDACKAETQKKLNEKKAMYESVLPIAESAYEDIRATLEKPEKTEIIRVLRYSTVDELLLAQADGDYWKDLTKHCHIWIHVNDEFESLSTLCLLETIGEFRSFVNDWPHVFTDNKDVNQYVYRKYIPFRDINQFRVYGNISQSISVFGGETGSYTGVSVNGIGFGEVQHNPVRIANNIHDNRFVVLHYKNVFDDADVILFPISELHKLIKLIPQFEK